MKTKLSILCILISFSSFLQAQDKEAFKREIYIKGKDSLNYRILYPENFSAEKKYPLLLFLHGAGERGSDNEKQLVHGSKLFLDAQNRQKNPAVVIFPQCPKDDYWAKVGVDRSENGNTFDFDYSGDPNKSLGLVMNLLDSMLKKDFVEQERVYVMGLSMGGMGTFEILYRKPKTFAAAVPICGGGDPATVKKYAKKVDLWVFHGAKDDVVPPSYSKEMVAALKAKKANVKFTVFPNANHNSWDPAFAEPGLLDWLFSQSKK
ncbi:phospholipase [Marivirga lumbricoides]|uniref:Phospholipase n=1 Tax=Marivirga lumbricoides TaxID=1046115 RepID=A0ABQ1MI36_9BACT|nr:phospholipase [Marivirga lumbricoides]